MNSTYKAERAGRGFREDARIPRVKTKGCATPECMCVAANFGERCELGPQGTLLAQISSLLRAFGSGGPNNIF